MTLQEAIKAVREQNLTKTQLEDYRNQMSALLSEMQLECAELEKMEAIFMAGIGNVETAINRKIHWKGSKEGLRLIEIKRYISATKTMMTSLRDRLYNFY